MVGVAAGVEAQVQIATTTWMDLKIRKTNALENQIKSKKKRMKTPKIKKTILRTNETNPNQEKET